jgi:hypothetical protein
MGNATATSALAHERLAQATLNAVNSDVATCAPLRCSVDALCVDQSCRPGSITLSGADAVISDDASSAGPVEPLIRRKRRLRNQAFHPPNRKL